MTLDNAMRFTLNYLFRGDTLLNWFLGVVLLVFPSQVDGLLGQRSLLPPSIYLFIGGGFLLFAAWQTIVVIRRRLGSTALIFAALMAEIPVLLLTVALIYLHSDLHPIWRVVLWIGDGYMLMLGAWYVFLAQRLATKKASGQVKNATDS
ncbi:MAG: hypothetical protein JXB30_06345 [Anaerolineae bacterium]|nr:hypothetical protein [Anaerolineae bacterium]